MDWSLAIVALALIAVAAVSKRLSGSPITPAMVFVSIGLLVGPKVLDEIDIASTSSTERALAEATLALCSSPTPRHRPQGAAARGLGSAAAARDRAAADDRPRSARRRRDLRRVDLLGGRHRRGDPGADRRRPRPGGRHRAARPDSDPPGPEHRERAQRRDLRAAAVRGRCGRGRRIADLRGANRDHPSARGGRLRDRRRGRRRAGDRSRRRLCRPTGI